MKKLNKIFLLLFLALLTIFSTRLSKAEAFSGDIITFYEVPLVCGAAPEIGCGSRIKPFFIETAGISYIKESWSNRAGTVIALVWDVSMTNEEEREKLIQPVFSKHHIPAEPVKDKAKELELSESLRGAGTWYRGMEVDKLSIEEAGIIAEGFVKFANERSLLNEQESNSIKKELEDYFKAELVTVRTYEELKSASTQNKWYEDGYIIFKKHVGKERADNIAKLYMEAQSGKFDACCDEKKDTGEDCCKKK